MLYARWAVLAVLGLAGCREFRTIEADGRCGNGVLEPEVGEDCDLHGLAPGSECGAPGVAEACRYVCARTDPEAPACPEGWGCGRDGICRAPSGELEARRVVPLDGLSLASGDLDDDGLADLVAFASDHISIAYGDLDGRFDSRLEVPITAPEPTPVVADVDGPDPDDADALAADVIVPQADGTQVFRGGRDRRLQPLAIPTERIDDVGPFGRALPVRAEAPFDRHAVLLLATGEAGTTFTLAGRATDAGEADALFRGRQVRDRWIVAVGDLDGEGTPDEVAIAAGDRVVVLEPRCESAPRDCRVDVRDVLEAPPGTTAPGDAWFADFEGDGDTDLFVLLQRRDETTIGVALLDETGKLGAVTVQTHFEVAVACQECPTRGMSSVLALGDLTGDDVADVVTANGVFVTEPGAPPKMMRRARSTRPWNGAVIGDLNDDGTPDVAATRPDAIDVLLTAPDGRFNAHFAQLEGEARFLRTGDFDGDLAADLAILEAPGRLVVLFRGPQRTPTERVVMADLPEVTGLETMRGQVEDRIDDLLMLTRGPQGAFLTVMAGTSSRRMLAPIPRAGRVYSTAAVGRFLGGALPDVVTGEVLNDMGRRYVGFRVTRGDELGLAPAAPLLTRAEAGCVPPDDFAGSATVADLDGDGGDELLFLESDSPDPGSAAGKDGWRLWILRFEGETMRCLLPGAIRSPTPPGRVRLADVDGDGALDAFAPLDASMNRNPGMRPAARPAMALWRGSKRAPWLDAPVVFTLSETEAPTFDLAAVELDGTPGAELFGVSPAGRVRIDIEPGGARVRPDGDGAVPAGVAEVHAMDIDGDGLGDLVAATGGEVFAWRQKACSAAQAHAGTCRRREPEDAP